jgi:4a-hydroxytetrahydrobiopterin dehydratase
MAEAHNRLSSREVSDRLGQVSGWSVEAGKLSKTFTFDDFMGAVDFVNRVARVAESQGHHPDLQVSWGRVVVDLTTHSAGGLTSKDFELAALIDQV